MDWIFANSLNCKYGVRNFLNADEYTVTILKKKTNTL